MKYSKYYSIVKVDEGYHIIYNSLTDSFVTLMGDVSIPDNPSELAEKNTSLYNKLVATGCIISDDTDEIRIVENLINKIDNNSKNFILHINPTLDCNFNC